MIYFDNAATTKPCAAAVEAINMACESSWGNPSSLHAHGSDARKLLESSRGTIADALGASPKEIIFTASGTEANNMALLGSAEIHGKRKKHIVTTTFEHSSVKNVLKHLLDTKGFGVTAVPPRTDGHIHAQDILSAVTEDTFLISAGLVCGENGAVAPLSDISEAIKGIGILLHCDAVQGFLRVPFDVNTLGVDFLSVSAHKIHAPKGIGALYVKKGIRLPPLIWGGGQEGGLRAGTESVPLIASFAAAVGSALPWTHKLKEYLLKKVSMIDGVTAILPYDAPHIVTLAVPGCPGEVLLRMLSDGGVCVSTGSACSKGARSSALESMKLPPKVLEGILRVSFSQTNTFEEIDVFIKLLQESRGRFF